MFTVHVRTMKGHQIFLKASVSGYMHMYMYMHVACCGKDILGVGLHVHVHVVYAGVSFYG